MWNHLANEDGGLYFVPFGQSLRLVEVVIGQKCEVSKAQIVSALRSLAGKVKICKARAAYDRFEMVEDEEGP